MQRKMRMRVSLPEDYAEKLYAQKSGTKESEMELPEVKDYKTRKLLGDEDIKQEVYGIDPYTHNLLLDSTPKELDWPLLEKHLFIEDVLLRTLNKQIRNFVGTRSRNTPMMYSLQLVIEENEKLFEDRDIKDVKMCRGILKGINSHPDDRYVAYRKVYTTFFFFLIKVYTSLFCCMNMYYSKGKGLIHFKKLCALGLLCLFHLPWFCRGSLI